MLRNELPSSAKFDAFYAKMRPIYLNLKYRLWNEISDELELLLLRSAVRLSLVITLYVLRRMTCSPFFLVRDGVHYQATITSDWPGVLPHLAGEISSEASSFREFSLVLFHSLEISVNKAYLLFRSALWLSYFS